MKSCQEQNLACPWHPSPSDEEGVTMVFTSSQSFFCEVALLCLMQAESIIILVFFIFCWSMQGLRGSSYVIVSMHIGALALGIMVTSGLPDNLLHS